MNQYEQEDFFRQVTIRIGGSLDIEKALTSMFDYMQGFMPIDAMALHYIEHEKKCILPVANVVRSGFVSLWQNNVSEVPVDDDFLAMAKEREESQMDVEVFNQSEALPPSVLRCFPYLANRSIMTLALRIDDHPLGGIILSTEGHNCYEPQHKKLLESVREPISLAMSNARRYMELVHYKDLLADDNRALNADLERLSGTEVVGSEFGLRNVMNMVRRVAHSNSPTLLLGETGTGKEVIANAIHASSARRDGPMIRMQCGAIPESLLDSELFGYEKGAFTGAYASKRGRFERAHGGTLFLDEIGELSAEAQVKLLRVLQESRFERIGGQHTITVDVRVIAATHRDLAAMVRQGSFREDLWYRLNVLPIWIPPLRLRREDITPLVHHFIHRKASEMNFASIPEVDSETFERLKAYDWPGNVRELQNLVERALILNQGNRLQIQPVPGIHQSGPTSSDGLQPSEPNQQNTDLLSMDDAMAAHIRLALEKTGGQVAGSGGAAELLQVNPSTLRFRMKKLGITLGQKSRQVTPPSTGPRISAQAF